MSWTSEGGNHSGVSSLGVYRDTGVSLNLL